MERYWHMSKVQPHKLRSYSFKDIQLEEHNRIWMHAIYKAQCDEEPINQRSLKVKLRDLLPKSFNPSDIDYKLCREDGLTLIGIWLIDPDSKIFEQANQIIKDIKNRIISSEGTVTSIEAAEISQSTGIPEDLTEKTLYHLSEIGLLGSYSRSQNRVQTISLNSMEEDDRFLNFVDIFDEMEAWYKPNYAPISVTSLFHNPDDNIQNNAVQKKSSQLIPNTAFIIMPIDSSNPELEDIHNTIKDVCKNFGIKAQRADEIEHSDKITDLILQKIKESEFLIADISLERPNVYYEIGYAHALEKRPIFIQKLGTKTHFDIANYNVRDFSNISQLKDILTKRFEALLDRKANNSNS